MIDPIKASIERHNDEQRRALILIPRCVMCGRWISEHWDFPDRCEGFVLPERKP
jgi:hypothetical protein